MAKKRKSKWMPLEEAIKQVAYVEGCSEEEAFEKLRAKLMTGEIRSKAVLKPDDDGAA